MNKEIISLVKELIGKDPEKRVLAVVKGRYPFVTNLAGLDLSNSISVLFLNSALRSIVPPDTLSKFDATVWFDGGEFWTEHNLAHLDSLEFPDLKQMIADLCRLVDPKNVRLVAMEEQFVRFIAEARNAHGIPGPTPKDIEPYSDKMKIKSMAMKNHIKTAKHKTVHINDLRKDQTSLEQTLSYPIFMKPVHGVGGAGTAKIADRTELMEWLKNQSQENAMFLAEEYIEGREINMLGFCQNGKTEFFPSLLIVRPPMTIYQFLHTGKPMPVHDGVDLDDKKKFFSFGQQLAKAFQAIEGSLFFVQFFDTDKGFVLNELACRPPGAIGSVIFYQNCGISPETVHIMGQIKSICLTDFIKPMPHFGMIVYPKRDLQNCKLVDIPEDRLTSKVNGLWLVKPGQNLCKANNIGDVIVRIYLWNEDYKSLLKDLDYLNDNYYPILA